MNYANIDKPARKGDIVRVEFWSELAIIKSIDRNRITLDRKLEPFPIQRTYFAPQLELIGVTYEQ